MNPTKQEKYSFQIKKVNASYEKETPSKCKWHETGRQSRKKTTKCEQNLDFVNKGSVPMTRDDKE